MTLPLAPRLHTVAGRDHVWKRKTLVSPWAKAPETPFPKREVQGGGGQDAWRIVVGKSSLVNWLSEATENWKPVLSKS